MSAARELTRARGGRWHGTYGYVRCPAHDDGRPSCRVRDGERRLLLHCHAGCAPADILKALRADGLVASAPPNADVADNIRQQEIAEKRRAAKGTRAAHQIWAECES